MDKKLRHLRLKTGQQNDVTTDPAWFVGMTVADGNVPWVVVMARGEVLIAAMHFEEKCIGGIGSGYLKADGGFGGDFLICPSEQRSIYLPVLLRCLFHKRGALIAQIVELAKSGDPQARWRRVTGLAMQWNERPSHHRLALRETMEATLAHYGSHTRRNLRYYLRKARHEGCQFLSDLTVSERIAAVLSLVKISTPRVPVEAAMRREATLRATPGSFAMSARAADGRWLSYLAGWRESSKTFVYWQMNDLNEAHTSVSTAIRSFLMEHEIARGVHEIVFVGGTSQVFMRCCEADQCVDQFAIRRGPRGKILSKLLRHILPQDHPLRTSAAAIRRGNAPL